MLVNSLNKFTLLMPLMVYGQNQAHHNYLSNQRLRGAVSSAPEGIPEEYKHLKSDEVIATSEAGKVNLILLTESGCPDCQETIEGPINGMIQSPGFADILNMRQFR
jgi:hypothetical protein